MLLKILTANDAMKEALLDQVNTDVNVSGEKNWQARNYDSKMDSALGGC